MAESNREQNVHWYYMLDGRADGPVVVSRLRQMARSGTLAADDLVRRGATGEWIQAGTVDEIHAKAREAPREPQPLPIANPSEHPAPGLLENLRYSLTEVTTTIIRSVTTRLGMLRTLAGYLVLIVASILLIQKIWEWKVSNPTSPLDPLQTYQSLWNELQANRNKKVEAAVWTEFATRGREQLRPIVARLEREAGVTNRTAQFLLWAGRDCLPKMFDDSRVAPGPSEKQFAEYLNKVKLLSEGKPLYVERRGMWRPAVIKTSPSKNWFAQIPVGAGFAVLLTATIIAIVVWFFLRKRRGRS